MDNANNEIQSQQPALSSLNRFEYFFLGFLGFFGFILGWSIFQSMFIKTLGHLWTDIAVDNFGFFAYFLGCLLGPFIASIVAMVTGRVVYKFTQNRFATYSLAILITTLYVVFRL